MALTASSCVANSTSASPEGRPNSSNNRLTFIGRRGKKNSKISPSLIWQTSHMYGMAPHIWVVRRFWRVRVIWIATTICRGTTWLCGKLLKNRAFETTIWFTPEIEVIVIIDSSRSAGWGRTSRSTTYRGTITVRIAVTIHSSTESIWVGNWTSWMSVTRLRVRIHRWRGRPERGRSVGPITTIMTTGSRSKLFVIHISPYGPILLEWTFEYLNVPKHSTGVSLSS